jgi:hypothetical protein
MVGVSLTLVAYHYYTKISCWRGFFEIILFLLKITKLDAKYLNCINRMAVGLAIADMEPIGHI